ncbi:DUF4810 domain-containing protein [Marinomonas atlantica]|uniref:DUF4810 domain-containing protein n=1 Tax=Marinomonas atlantica TaxID=1806668 RepID=UPI0008328931|nr:DUF4810 domain-containing protein [Marinomonas atlantica]
MKPTSVINSSKARFSLLGIILFALVGCSAPRSTFYWGEYESMLYGMYLEPGSADSATQIAILLEDIQKSRSMGMRIAPGIHAHLGYMYALEGNMPQAKAELILEKNLFPESATLIDGMLTRIEGKNNDVN